MFTKIDVSARLNDIVARYPEYGIPASLLSVEEIAAAAQAELDRLQSVHTALSPAGGADKLTCPWCGFASMFKQRGCCGSTATKYYCPACRYEEEK
jgi:predicted RNA-binding Zn-ribbon protein involved in translation (DUF1610 family)